jgi:type VI secretion system protein ImpF
VLNYGIPDLPGLTIVGADTAAIEKAVREAVARFEPRIAPHSLRVAIETGQSAAGRSAMIFRIEGELWAKPAPQALYLKTLVDLETGSVTVSEGQA